MTDKATHTPLPCPFCGSRGISHRVSTGWRVSCTACDCQPRPGLPPKTEDEAVRQWNTRAVNSHHDLIEALREARDLLLAIEQNDQNVWWVNHDDPEKAVCDTYSKVWSALTKAEAGHD